MAHRVISPHGTIGWSRSAATDVMKKARKQHKENRKKAFNKVKENFVEFGRSGRDELLAELKNPWNLLPPVLLIKVFFMPLRIGMASIGLVTKSTVGLLNERKNSLAMKKSAMKMVGYAIIEEMQRDPAYMEKIKDIVTDKDRPLKWLYVTRKGKIILSDNPKMAKSSLEHALKMLDAPRVNMEDLVKRATLNYVDAVPAKHHTMVALRGEDLIISRLKNWRDEKGRIVKAGAIDVKKAKSADEVISKENVANVRILDPGIRDKLTVELLMKDGFGRRFTVDEEEAKKIYRRMKK